MSYPTFYDITYSYSGFQASLGDGSFPGTQLDADMAGLSDSVASINAFIQTAFRSDGVLKAASLPGTDPILQYVDEAASAAAAEAAEATEIASAAATSASASATAAAGSATNAATSETQAASSASAAQTARTGAETAQTAAAASAAASAAAAAVFDPSAYLSKSGNLAGLTDKAAARANLALATVAASGAYGDLAGKPTLGTAAPKNVGTGAGNVVALDANGKLPAVPGDQLTGIKTITAVPAIALSGQMSALFTGIPADARRLTLQLNAVSTITDVSNTYIRLGTAGALVTSGYDSGACGLGSGVGGGYGAAGDGSGFYMLNVPANERYTGIVTLTRVGTTNTWLSSYVFSRNLGAIVVAGGGGVTLPGPIDRLSLVSLSYAFDNGDASLLVE